MHIKKQQAGTNLQRFLNWTNKNNDPLLLCFCMAGEVKLKTIMEIACSISWIDGITIGISIISVIIAFISCNNSQKQYRSQIKPYLFCGYCKNEGDPINYIEIGISNDNKAAIINKIYSKSKNINKIEHNTFPCDLKKEDDLLIIKIHFKESEKIKALKFKFAIKYTDREGNRYTAIFSYSDQHWLLYDRKLVSF